MARARKLYYNLLLSGASASGVVAPTITADRDGNLLDALTALTGGASSAAKQRQELVATFVPYSTTVGHVTNQPVFEIAFLRNGTDLALYLTVGGASVPTKAGSSAAFTTNPRVRVKHKTAGASWAIRGTVYIQRQHTIEA